MVPEKRETEIYINAKTAAMLIQVEEEFPPKIFSVYLVIVNCSTTSEF